MLTPIKLRREFLPLASYLRPILPDYVGELCWTGSDAVKEPEICRPAIRLRVSTYTRTRVMSQEPSGVVNRGLALLLHVDNTKQLISDTDFWANLQCKH